MSWRTLVDRLRSLVERRTEEAESILAAKRELESRIINKPGVVSVGVGRAEDGTEVIVVGVDGTRPDLEAQIPEGVSGFPVEIRRIGPLRAQ